MARAKARRKKKKGRGIGFLLLAGLSLLIAAFIARREIPGLIKHASRSPAAPAQADTGGLEGLAGGGEKLHPPAEPRLYAGGGDRAVAARRLASPSKDSHEGAASDRPGEYINGSERQRLESLIKEKSH